MISGADETIAQVEDDVARTAERAARMPAFEAALARVRGTAQSSARDVFVEVDSTGRVRGLKLADIAMRRSAATLSREILATIAAAEADARRRSVRDVATLLGEDDPITLQLARAAEESP